MPRTTFDLPFPEVQAAQFLATTFSDCGNKQSFAPVVIVLGHGSASVNNPFFAAYQCGACQGRDGATSARLVARIANDKTVRSILAADHGIVVPDDTHFIGGGHNTSMDSVTYFDLDQLPEMHRAAFGAARETINVIENALGLHALERCRRVNMRNFVVHVTTRTICIKTREIVH